MALYDWGYDTSFRAAVDLSASQYYFVKAGSVKGEVTINNVAGGSILGVLQNDPRANEEATVRMLGSTKVRANTEAGASPLNYGGFVKSGSTGMAIGYINSTASQFAAGIMLDTTYSTGSGGFVEIFLLPSFVRA